MLHAKRGFAGLSCANPGLSCANPGSMGCGKKTWILPRNPGIAHALSIDQDNPGIALRKA